MSIPEENVVADYYENYKETQAYIFRTEARKARNMIFTVAIILFLGNILGLAMASLLTTEYFISALIFPIIFLGLGFFAPRQPMAAMVIAVIIFAIIVILSLLMGGAGSLISGLLVKAVIVFCLIAGFNNAREAQRAKKEIQ